MPLSKEARSNILRLLSSGDERNAKLALRLLQARHSSDDFLASLCASFLGAGKRDRHFLRKCLKAMAAVMMPHSPLHSLQRPKLDALLGFGTNPIDEPAAAQAIRAAQELFALNPIFLARYLHSRLEVGGPFIMRWGQAGEVADFMESLLREKPGGKVLNLRGLELSELPGQLSAFHDISTLDGSNNRIRQLPRQLLDFPKLHTIRLANNELSDIPAFLFQLDNLRELDLRFNPFRMSWLEFLRHPHKEKLKVQLKPEKGFSLHTFHPDDALIIMRSLAYQAENMAILDLSAQGLRRVPDALSRMRKLSMLDLRHNPLPFLPHWLLRLRGLRRILCSPETNFNPGAIAYGVEVLRDNQFALPQAKQSKQPAPTYGPPPGFSLPMELEVSDDMLT